MANSDHSPNPSPTNSPTPSPRTAFLQTMMNNQFQMLRRELEEMRVRVDRRGGRESSEDESPRRRHRRGRRETSQTHGERRRDDRLEGVKLQVPSFLGLNNPETYLEWELKMEQVFDCHQYSDHKKVKVAALEFKEYAMVWWDQYQKDRRRCGEEVVNTWEEMKFVMRKRFVPSSYQRDIQNKLQRLTQGNKSVDEYVKEMELALIRSNFHEDREATMARFLHGLNPEIQDVVELQHYVELDELVQKAIKVEQQLKRKKSKFSANPKFTSTGWKDRTKKEGTSHPKEAVGASNNGKQAVVPNQRSREVKCFKCLGHGHIAS